MTFYVITLFPQMFDGVFTSSIIKRAIDKRLIKIKLINLRDFAKDKRKTVDDTPYGGGKGMLIKVDVVYNAIKSIKPKPYTILLSASGEKYDQKMAQSLSKKKSITIICGHYEGIDARIEEFVDNTLSVGDFVLTGGEIAAMAIIDSTARLTKDVINPESLSEESFSNSNLLEYPQYTKPKSFKGLQVPKTLLSGNHQKIEQWRKIKSKELTKKVRPDLTKSD